MLKVVLAIGLVACHAPGELHTTIAVDADAGVYELVADEYVCTAWAVKAPEGRYHGPERYDEFDLAITAGHCCDGHAGETVQLTTGDGLSVPAQPLVWEDSEGPEADICVLRVLGPRSPGLTLADDLPMTGFAVEYTGYPLGQRTTEPGVFLGVRDASAFETTPAFPGASGAALYTESGVFAIVDQITPSPDGSGSIGASGTALAEIRRVLALVR